MERSKAVRVCGQHLQRRHREGCRHLALDCAELTAALLLNCAPAILAHCRCCRWVPPCPAAAASQKERSLEVRAGCGCRAYCHCTISPISMLLLHKTMHSCQISCRLTPLVVIGAAMTITC